MLELRVEWEEAPGVVIGHLAATWARLEIRANDRAVTRFWSTRSNGVREGVFVSVFPLARWVVEHWWSLLDEGLPRPEVLEGACRFGKSQREWLRRHSLLFARDGMAYPDLLVYREDTDIGVRWVADLGETATPGRFIDSGSERFRRSDVEATLASFVEAVIARLEESGCSDGEVDELRSDWNAIAAADAEETQLCGRLAALGLDPYAQDTDEDLEELVGGSTLPESVLFDVLAASRPSGLRLNLTEAARLLAALPATHALVRPRIDAPLDPLPYRAGYARAAAVREAVGAKPEPIANLDALVCSVMGGEVERVWTDQVAGDIDGAVQIGEGAGLAAGDRSPRGRRFLTARALHHWLFVNGPNASRRLLTRANGWQQAASRAFAAELLAPAEALGQHHPRVDWERVPELADEFDVDAMVITHQIDNHGLG